jgi:putative protease
MIILEVIYVRRNNGTLKLLNCKERKNKIYREGGIMKKTNIMVPVRDLETAKYMCEAGCNEIYCGVDGRVINKAYTVFSFNGRFNRKDDGTPTQIKTEEELNQIVEYCHSKDVKVYYTANCQYLDSSLKREFDEYIKIGLDANVDGFIVSNFGILQYLHEKSINKPIIAGLFLLAVNDEYFDILKRLGVFRVVMPHSITLSEIRKVKEKYDMEIEIFGHIGGGNNCGRCMFIHSPSIPEIGPACRSSYNVYRQDTDEVVNTKFYDGAADCTLCSLEEIMNADIDSLKVIGRGNSNPAKLAGIVSLYVQARDNVLKGVPSEESLDVLFDGKPEMRKVWENAFCNGKRCKLKDCDITRSYII